MISPRALRLPLLIGAFAIAACLVPGAPALAQMSFGGAPTGGHDPDPGAGDDAQAKADAAANAPPPALPGAVPIGPDMPSSHAALDMNPNAALFDAIDRGDLAAAKDALSRGADLEASNVLGEKPIEMSIDLSRNDITFLLLSMRSVDSSNTQVASGSVSASGAGGKPDKLALRARRGQEVAQAASTPASNAGEDGGTPKPEIGFLGFNGS